MLEKFQERLDSVLRRVAVLMHVPMIPFEFVGEIVTRIVQFFFTAVVRLNMGYWFITVPVALIFFIGVAASMAFTWKFNSSIVESWTIADSDAVTEENHFVDMFGASPRALVFIAEPSDGSNALSSDFLLKIMALETKARSFTVNGKTYDDLCIKNPSTGFCVVYSPLAAWEYNSAAISADPALGTTLTNLIKLYPSFKMAVGPATGDPYTSVDMFKSTLAMSSDVDLVDDVKEYETEFINMMADGASGVDLLYYTSRSVDDASSPGPSIIALILASLTMMFTFTLISLGGRTLVTTRITMTLVAISGILLSLAAGMGASLAVVEISAVFFAIPFLILGVGIDNVFLATSESDRIRREEFPTDRRLTKQEVRAQTQEAYRHAGPSITMTTCTDTLSFLVGATSKLPAVRCFCIASACCIVAVYLFQLFVFSFFLYLDNLRQENKRYDVVFLSQSICRRCIVGAVRAVIRLFKGGSEEDEEEAPEPKEDAAPAPLVPVDDGEGGGIDVEASDATSEASFVTAASTLDTEVPPAPEAPGREPIVVEDARLMLKIAKYANLDFLLGKVLGTIVTNMYVAPVLLLSFTAVSIFGLYHVNDLKTGIEPEDAMRKTAHGTLFIEGNHEYFPDYTVDIAVDLSGSGNIDLTTAAGQAKLDQLVTKIESDWRWYLTGGMKGFVAPYKTWLAANKPAAGLTNGLPNTDPAARGWLVEFIDHNKEYAGDFKMTPPFGATFNPATYTVDAVKMMVTRNAWADSKGKVDYMLQTREDFTTLSEDFGTDTFIYDALFIFIELDANQLNEIVTNLSMALAAAFVVCTVFLKSPLIAAIVVGTVFSIDCWVMAVMYLADLKLNSIAVAVLVIGIGFSADYVSHIVFGCLLAPPDEYPSRGRRAARALETMAKPIAQGAISTFLGISCLLLSDLVSIQTIGKFLVTIIVCAILHGMTFSPALLTLFSPMMYPKKTKELPQ